MRQADIEVASGSGNVNYWEPLLCYPRGNFYPLSSGDSTLYLRITKTCFRTCSNCCSCSQAYFYLYAYTLISIQGK